VLRKGAWLPSQDPRTLVTVQPRARTPFRISLIGATVITAALAMPVTPAVSGTYTVLSCQDRNGVPTPAGDDSGGWTPGTSGQAGLAAVDRCFNASRDLLAAVSGPSSYPIGARAWWRFVAPSDTVIDSFGLQYWATARPFDSRTQGLVSMLGSQSGRLVNLDGTGYSATRWYSLSRRHDSYLELSAQCDGPVGAPNCDPNQIHAEVHIERSEFVLSDAWPPEVQSARGSAVDASTWEGIQTFTLQATDRGGGVYQAILDVDGVPRATRPVDEWAGRCVDTTAGQHVFRYPRPCLTSVDAVVPVDTSVLPAGKHEISLRVSDAAGNVGTAYSARKVIVVPGRRVGPGSDLAERGPANGENPSDAARLVARWTRTARVSLTAHYGVRSVIRGRLTDATGVGIRNARIELLSAIDGRPGAPLDKGGARTREDGRFTLIQPRNASSRTLLLRYRSHVNDTVPAAERALRLKVRAGIKLSVKPHFASRGHAIRLGGRLVGRPLPRVGKVVELQARSVGEPWITFRTMRATRTGQFATRYLFRRGGPALYEIRARVRAAADYPYATGVSRVVHIRVR
jgi:hypothetical protein